MTTNASPPLPETPKIKVSEPIELPPEEKILDKEPFSLLDVIE